MHRGYRKTTALFLSEDIRIEDGDYEVMSPDMESTRKVAVW